MTDFVKFLKENNLDCGYLYKGKCCASPHAEYSDTPCDGDCYNAIALRERFNEWKKNNQ